jgi:leucine dehydrogenase
LGSVEHEQVVFCHDPETGLRSIIAIHSTALGPGLGGVRMAPYPSVDTALRDCLRLARGMTYKAAVAGLNLGGAKSVIIGDPATEKTEELLLAHGRFIESLAGRYVPGIDMGTTQDDLRVIGRATREVAGVGEDPSPRTALGVFTALQATAERLFGSPGLSGRAVAIQGAGHVGEALAALASQAGAGVVLADVNAARADALASRLGARAVAAGDILFTPCDILVPSAVGGVINDQTIDALQCRAVVAAANNVLDRPDHGDRLRERGILYGVDFVANSGGIMFLEAERLRLSPSETEQRIKTVGTILRRVYDRAEADAISTARAAELIAEERLAAAATVRPRLVTPGERKYASA